MLSPEDCIDMIVMINGRRGRVRTFDKSTNLFIISPDDALDDETPISYETFYQLLSKMHIIIGTNE